MSTGTSVEGDQTNTRITVCRDERRTSFTNTVDGNQDLFLAASLQFLHRLLAERTLRYEKLDGIPVSRMRTEDVKQEGNSTAGQLYFQRIDQIEEYRRQLRCMENFLSTIHLDDKKPLCDTAGCDAISSNKTKDFGRRGNRQSLESTELPDDSYEFISQNSSLRASDYPRSNFNCDKSPTDISGQTKINVIGIDGPGVTRSTVRRTAADVSNDFTVCPETHFAGVSTWNTAINDGVRNSSSYADMVRNAVAGLAGNCRKKCKNKREKEEVRMVSSPEEIKCQEGYQSDIESEISSESLIRAGQDLDIPKEIPLRVQLAMETDASPKKPLTLLVRVPNTVFNLLSRKISNRDTKISSTDRTEPGKKKKRIASVFRNLLKGRKTPSSTTVYSTKEKLPSHVSLDSEGTSHNTSISTLQGSLSCDVFEQTESAELCYKDKEFTTEPRNDQHASLKRTLVPPTESANGRRDEEISLNLSPRVISYQTKPCNGKAAGTAWRKVAHDKALRTEVPYHKTRIVKDLTNYRDEKIIPLRCSEGSPQLGNKCGGISQRDVDTFLKLAAEMRKPEVYQGADNKHVEIPIEVKKTEAPLRLRKTPEVSTDLQLSDRPVFHLVTKNSHQTPNGIETREFLEMLVGTLPEGAYFPQTEYSKSEELPSALDSVENETQDNIRLRRISEDSALEVLLRHIATDASNTSCTKPCEAERDTTVQPAPKRQLSKISVCYSSESLSGSDHEILKDEPKNSTDSQDEYRVHSHVLSNEPRNSYNPQYFHHYEANGENYTRNYWDDKITVHGKSLDRHPGVKIRSSTGSTEVIKYENSNLTISSFGTQFRERPKPCSRTEVIIEEENCSNIETEVKTQGVMGNENRNCLSTRKTENEESGLCHPVLSKQICGDRRELADAMIRWWGPQINYSTTPSSRTQLSAYSVSINNLILRNG